MSKETLLLEKIIQKVDYIEQIVKKCNSIDEAMEDAILSRAAILMRLEAIAEQSEKLSENGYFETLSKFNASDVKGVRRVRNYIAHRYDEVDDGIIIDIIKDRLPAIKTTCQQALIQ